MSYGPLVTRFFVVGCQHIEDPDSSFVVAEVVLGKELCFECIVRVFQWVLDHPKDSGSCWLIQSQEDLGRILSFAS